MYLLNELFCQRGTILRLLGLGSSISGHNTPLLPTGNPVGQRTDTMASQPRVSEGALLVVQSDVETSSEELGLEHGATEIPGADGETGGPTSPAARTNTEPMDTGDALSDTGDESDGETGGSTSPAAAPEPMNTDDFLSDTGESDGESGGPTSPTAARPGDTKYTDLNFITVSPSYPLTDSEDESGDRTSPAAHAEPMNVTKDGLLNTLENLMPMRKRLKGRKRARVVGGQRRRDPKTRGGPGAAGKTKMPKNITTLARKAGFALGTVITALIFGPWTLVEEFWLSEANDGDRAKMEELGIRPQFEDSRMLPLATGSNSRDPKGCQPTIVFVEVYPHPVHHVENPETGEVTVVHHPAQWRIAGYARKQKDASDWVRLSKEDLPKGFVNTFKAYFKAVEVARKMYCWVICQRGMTTNTEGRKKQIAVVATMDIEANPEKVDWAAVIAITSELLQTTPLHGTGSWTYGKLKDVVDIMLAQGTGPKTTALLNIQRNLLATTPGTPDPRDPEVLEHNTAGCIRRTLSRRGHTTIRLFPEERKALDVDQFKSLAEIAPSETFSVEETKVITTGVLDDEVFKTFIGMIRYFGNKWLLSGDLVKSGRKANDVLREENDKLKQAYDDLMARNNVLKDTIRDLKSGLATSEKTRVESEAADNVLMAELKEQAKSLSNNLTTAEEIGKYAQKTKEIQALEKTAQEKQIEHLMVRAETTGKINKIAAQVDETEKEIVQISKRMMTRSRTKAQQVK